MSRSCRELRQRCEVPKEVVTASVEPTSVTLIKGKRERRGAPVFPHHRSCSCVSIRPEKLSLCLSLDDPARTLRWSATRLVFMRFSGRRKTGQRNTERLDERANERATFSLCKDHYRESALWKIIHTPRRKVLQRQAE